MSKCKHGVFLGVGCKECPKTEEVGEASAERIGILTAAMMISKKMEAETDPKKKERMKKDFYTLMRVRLHY